MDIISAIDSATGCHQCGNPLGSSPSSDFCSEFCQRTWQSNRAAPPLLSEFREIPLRSVSQHTVYTVTSPGTAHGNSGLRWLMDRRDAESQSLAYFEWTGQ